MPVAEARLAEGQVVLPHPDEPLVEAERPNLVEAAHEPRPCRQRADVMAGDVAHVGDQEPRVASRGFEDSERRAQAAGEDVGLDPVRAAELALICGIREGDHLDAQASTRGQRPVAPIEEGREVFGADGLEHLDRDDRVVHAGDLAVVAQLDVDQMLQAGRPHALPGELVMLLRDRDDVTRQPSSPAA